MLTKSGLRAVFLFIGELNGFKSGKVKDKVAFGIKCYMESKLHDIDVSTEDGQSELHENIWLERIYDKIDSMSILPKPALNIIKRRVDRESAKLLLSKLDMNVDWDIPLELDASASMLGVMGALLGEERLLTETNMHGSELSDPWNRGMNRTKFKHAATPLLYGSSRACHELWQDKGHEYTLEDIKLFNEQLAKGSLGVANQFKEFLITSCKPKATMNVHIFNEQFEIECNRFRNIGEQTKIYDIFDTETSSIRRIHHTDTKRIPDLEQFRRYFVTLLIHNLDSQVANAVVSKVIDKYGFALDIHDAFLVHPNAATYTRKVFAREIDKIYANRKTILANYFQSIGIGGESQSRFNALMDMVQPVHNFKCRYMALK